MSILNEIEDDAWIQIHHHVASLTNVLINHVGRKPTAEEFAEVLTRAITETNVELFSDIPAGAVASVKFALKPISSRIQPGSIIALPPDGGRNFLLYLGANRFGDAFGVLKPQKALNGNLPEFTATAVYFYSTLDFVRKKKWKIVAFRPDLLKNFPSKPEIFHRKNVPFNKDNPLIGKFGSAESPDLQGTLREIDQAEAERMGLNTAEYQSAFMPDQVPTYLDMVYRRLI